jgi:HD-like signal output (HDOD) protein
MKKNILFVDDNKDILTSLKRMLRIQRHEWEMDFVDNGYAAMTVLAEKSIDVIVSDIRMPEMDGVELLTLVKDNYPQVVRIVLSGQSDLDVLLKSVGPTHQFLAKPCDAETLIDVVNRSCALQNTLANENLAKLVTGLGKLPSLPAVYQEIIAELRSPLSSLGRIGEIVSKDMGMTAKILQLVNSAFFGLPQHVSTPAQAATLLGVDTIKALVLSIKIFDCRNPPSMKKLDINRLWKHSNRVSALAKNIAAVEGLSKKETDDTFMASILHDVGILLLATKLPVQYNKVFNLISEENCSLLEAELKVFKASHAEVGAYLMELWGFSNPIVEAILYHHHPLASPFSAIGPLAILHIATALDSIKNTKQVAGEDAFFDMDYLDKIGIADRIPVWQKIQERLSAGEDVDA